MVFGKMRAWNSGANCVLGVSSKALLYPVEIDGKI